MRLRLFTELTILFNLKFALAFNFHIDLVSVCYVILIFTNGTD